MSLVGVYDAEWRKRKINLFSVLRSFVSQLSPGQELTKVSLPSELCHPFSMLELVAYRELQLFHMLFDIVHHTSPYDRFLCVVRWYLGLVREETMEKKPFNPVIGETHLCWVDHGDGDISEFIGEQVSHHPPVSAFIVRNQKRGLSITGAITFKVGFGSNCASVTTGGEVTIHTGQETYTMTKCVPDMMVNNVIWGEKYLIWHGAITITCSDNDYVAKINLSEESVRNILEGKIYEGEKVIHILSGLAGEKAYIGDYHERKEVRESNESDEGLEGHEDDGGHGRHGGEQLFVDLSNYKDNTIIYLPTEVQSQFNSLKLWAPVKDAIIKYDLAVADEEKKKIEADQRNRQRERLLNDAWKDSQFFIFREKGDPIEGESQEEVLDRGAWNFKNNFSIDMQYITSVMEETDRIRAAAAAEDQAKLETQQNSDKTYTETCTVQ
eukprot:TRINITY_DN543_c2_g1_i1.p1 TRINITY_DN543_c2_g1~~TRINITY_DN543_c2_g1_i1.p1  ORF type:complete len:439 (+),score=74.10 TRINITY_DN543_c2_g1_i1:120-1436(+)